MLPDPLHFNSICRICLSTSDKLVNIFDSEEDIISLLVSMTAISISSNDNLPQNICAFCTHQIKTTHYFILKCQESDRKLRLSIENTNVMLVDKSNESTILIEEHILNDVIEYDSVEYESVDVDSVGEDSQSHHEPTLNELMLNEMIENVPNKPSPHSSELSEHFIDDSSVDTSSFLSNYCILCQIEYVSFSAFREHMKSHHQVEKIEYTETEIEHLEEEPQLQNLCDICNKSFATPKSLERHKTSHESNKKKVADYQCNICGKFMTHINHFKIHMRCHKNFKESIDEQPESTDTDSTSKPKKIKKRHTCHICERTCSSRSNLAVHIRRHSGKMTNFCNICGKGYPRSTDLTVHMRQHTGEKPFVCITCNRGFKRSDKLTIHMRKHTGERPFECSNCSKGFSQRNDLLIHQRRNVCTKKSKITKD